MFLIAVRADEIGELHFYCQCCPYIYAIDRQVSLSATATVKIYLSMHVVVSVLCMHGDFCTDEGLHGCRLLELSR